MAKAFFALENEARREVAAAKKAHDAAVVKLKKLSQRLDRAQEKACAKIESRQAVLRGRLGL